jgi:LTXXQ motif family protein
MSKVSSFVGVILFFSVTLLSTSHPAQALGLRLGPFYFGVPFGGYRARRPPGHDTVARTNPESAPESDAGNAAQSDQPTLLYPVLAWARLDQAIFAPGPSTRWPFSYDSIFAQAFATHSADHAADFCLYRNAAADLAIRIEREIAPSAAQKPLLQNLATAIGQANGYLMKSCPKEIPLRPVARLELMEKQIDATIMALEVVRPPLQALEQSLDDKQRARFDAAGATDDHAVAAGCKSTTERSREPLAQLEQAAQPTDAQRKTLANVKDAFDRAANDLDAFCAGVAPPPTALGRLEAIEDRLDATWRAVQTIDVALADLEKGLSDEQKARVDALVIASAH